MESDSQSTGETPPFVSAPSSPLPPSPVRQTEATEVKPPPLCESSSSDSSQDEYCAILKEGLKKRLGGAVDSAEEAVDFDASFEIPPPRRLSVSGQRRPSVIGRPAGFPPKVDMVSRGKRMHTRAPSTTGLGTAIAEAPKDPATVEAMICVRCGKEYTDSLAVIQNCCKRHTGPLHFSLAAWEVHQHEPRGSLAGHQNDDPRIYFLKDTTENRTARPTAFLWSCYGQTLRNPGCVPTASHKSECEFLNVDWYPVRGMSYPRGYLDGSFEERTFSHNIIGLARGEGI